MYLQQKYFIQKLQEFGITYLINTIGVFSMYLRYKLTLKCMNSFFLSFSGYNLR